MLPNQWQLYRLVDTLPKHWGGAGSAAVSGQLDDKTNEHGALLHALEDGGCLPRLPASALRCVPAARTDFRCCAALACRQNMAGSFASMLGCLHAFEASKPLLAWKSGSKLPVQIGKRLPGIVVLWDFACTVCRDVCHVLEKQGYFRARGDAARLIRRPRCGGRVTAGPTQCKAAAERGGRRHRACWRPLLTTGVARHAFQPFGHNVSTAGLLSQSLPDAALLPAMGGVKAASSIHLWHK